MVMVVWGGLGMGCVCVHACDGGERKVKGGGACVRARGDGGRNSIPRSPQPFTACYKTRQRTLVYLSIFPSVDEHSHAGFIFPSMTIKNTGRVLGPVCAFLRAGHHRGALRGRCVSACAPAMQCGGRFWVGVSTDVHTQRHPPLPYRHT